jgi:hypothetical protein
MSKGISGDGINVKMELWKRAHEIEAKAMEAGDMQAMNEAAEWKGKLSMAIAAEQTASNPPTQMPSGIKVGNGVKGCLDEVRPLDHIGVDDDGEQRHSAKGRDYFPAVYFWQARHPQAY